MADCLLALPNPPGPIAIDAKFPLEGYKLLQDAKTPDEKTRAEKVFINDILKHVNDISSKYIIPGETSSHAIMFLPSEAIYAELFGNYFDVVRKSNKKKVWIVSPSTLMATLSTVRAILMDVKMREQAGLIQKEVQILMGDIERLDKRVTNLAGHFSLAEKDIREIQVSTGKITSRGDRIQEVKLEDDDTEKLDPKPDRPRIVKG